MTQLVERWSPGTRVVGTFRFEGNSKEDLPFGRGDILTIVKPTQDPNWYKAQSLLGREGMIPANYVAMYIRNDENHHAPVLQMTPQRQPQPAFNKPAPKPGSFPPYTKLNPATIPTLPRVEPVPTHQEIHQQSMPWYHGKISREQAEALLESREDGLFLVRESTNYSGDYTLCVCFMDKVEHYHIKCSRSKLTVDDETYFDNLIKLVQHYEVDADGLCTRLIKAVPKKGAFDMSVDVKDFEKSGWALREADIHMTELIGRGEFGAVYKATYQNEPVAVKQLQDTTSTATQSFLKEASVMTSLRHPNLVRLIGVVISDSILLVTEFMSKGNLVDYLRSRGRAVITKRNQIEFSADTAAAMAFLESKNLVHRDLAARNVLVNDDGVAKVSDFGLARRVDVYQEGGKFPVKWTAPEALRESKFTNKSDVWSFGIMLWEIYSFGRVPYPRIPLTEVVMHVERGYRMEAPEACPPEIYTIMLSAWNSDPAKRPTFAQITVDINKLCAATV